MCLGIVRKVIFINSNYGRYKMAEHFDDYSSFGGFEKAVKINCYLYVDFCNQVGKLQTVMFKNQYYYKDFTFVILENNDNQYSITKALDFKELEMQSDDLRFLLEKEKQRLAEERKIINEQYGELESEIYDSAREDIINYIEKIICGDLKNLRLKLLNLAKYLIENADKITPEQHKRYNLLLMDLSNNFEKINSQLAYIGEKEIELQIIYDIDNILSYIVKCYSPTWFTYPISCELSELEIKQLIRTKRLRDNELKEKYGALNI